MGKMIQDIEAIKKLMKKGYKPYSIHIKKDKTRFLEFRQITKYGERKAFYDGVNISIEPMSIREKFNRKFKNDYKK